VGIFSEQVWGDSPERHHHERARRAEHARKAYFAALARKSALVRRAAREIPYSEAGR